jgi:putative Holliday junction resolvase
MKYLAIDYGQKRVGLATCDEAEFFASPFATREKGEGKKSTPRLLADLIETVRAHQIEGIVLGLPRGASGEETDMEREVRAFGTALQNALRDANLNIAIEWCDERFTTAQVLKSLREAGVSQKDARNAGGAESIDARAAAVILQDFLDAKKLRASWVNEDAENESEDDV